MRRKIFWLFHLSFLSTSLVFSQWAQITEVQPFSIGDESEWFEFLVRTGREPIDIAEWKISNGKTEKVIGDFRESLIVPSDIELLSGSGYTQDQIIVGPNQEAYLAWKKSPISLVNSGGIVQVLNEKNEKISEFIYPAGKTGKRKDYAYSEVFNWDGVLQKIYPLMFRENFDGKFIHTKGFSNQSSPTFPEDTQILISEISPDRDTEKGGDFIEIYFRAGPKKINLKYAEVKHNGTTLYFFEEDFWVSPQQFLTIWVGKDFSGITKRTAPYEIYSDKKEGLSGGSGTVEFILFSDTSFEQTEDFVCYMDEKLSQTEQRRVSKNTENWQSDCIDISTLIQNQSIARTASFSDGNSKSDFFSHYNGSPGNPNMLLNNAPVATITVQGSGKTVNTSPFYINLTGEDSTDPDGTKDLKSFIWKINGEIFSEESNPDGFKREELGEYLVELAVTDFSGETDTVSQLFSVVSSGGAPSGASSKSSKALIAELLASFPPKGEKNINDEFFTEFLALAPESFWEEMMVPPIPISSFDLRGKEILQITKPVDDRREKWIAKNIGWAFVDEF